MSNVNSPRSMPNYRLHPLMHTLLEFDLSPNMVVCQRDLLSGYYNEVGFVKDNGMQWGEWLACFWTGLAALPLKMQTTYCGGNEEPGTNGQR